MVKELDASDLEHIQNSNETWIIDFWAEWCKPCQKLSPRFEKVSEEIDSVNFGKVDMQENQDAGTKLGVRSLPTLVIMKNGEEVSRKSGLMGKSDLKDWISEET